MDHQEALDALCAQLNLEPEGIQAVRRAVATLSVKRRVKSGPARTLELKRLQSQASALKHTLQSLDIFNSTDMRYALDYLGFPGPLLNHKAHERWAFELSLDATVALLDLLTQAAQEVDEAIPASHLRTTKPSSARIPAVVLDNVRFAVCKPGGLDFARDSEFEDLCDAIFLAAGLDTGSAWTIRLLQESRANGQDARSMLRGA